MTMTAMTEIAHETGIDETESDPATGDAVEATGAVPDPADAAGLDANRPEGTDAGHANDEAVGAVADDAATGDCPPEVPAKFWDAKNGTVRTEALVRSYNELERKLGGTLPVPKDEDDAEALERLYGALGRPSSPDEYEIEPPHPLIEPDPDLNRRLHEAGFSQKQAQLVYELAADHLLPVIGRLVDDVEASRQVQQLEEEFGGTERWNQLAKQMRSWGQTNLEPEVFAALASSYDGIIALNEMMRRAEPRMASETGSEPLELTEEGLQAMMRDPRYWRDRDPELITRVTEGFKRLFPD